MNNHTNQVTIAIPTYKLDNRLIKIVKLLEKQTYKNFNILAVYKHRGTDIHMEQLLKTKLDLTLINCEPNKIGPNFIEAMNVIFKKSDGDIIINIDDDISFGKKFIEEHLLQHHNHPELGIATGSCIDKSNKIISAKQNLYLLDAYVDKPISRKFFKYEGYIGKSGMMLHSHKTAEYMLTIAQRGFNMSWKKEALLGFKMPNYTIRAFRNEQAAALEVINRGYTAIKFKGAQILHLPLTHSLTRSNNILHKKEFIVEKVLFAYYSAKFFDVDLKVLEMRTRIDDFFTRIMDDKRNNGYILGHEITKKAINESWSEKKVKNQLMKIVSESKHPFGRYS